jgi:hypothetical protein
MIMPKTLKEIMLDGGSALTGKIPSVEELRAQFDALATRRVDRGYFFILISTGSVMLLFNLGTILRGDLMGLLLAAIILIFWPIGFLINKKNRKTWSIEKKMQQASQYEALLLVFIVTQFALGLLWGAIKLGFIQKLNLLAYWPIFIVTIPLTAFVLRWCVLKLSRYWDPDWYE